MSRDIYALFYSLLSLSCGVFEWEMRGTHCEGVNDVCQKPSRVIEKKAVT